MIAGPASRASVIEFEAGHAHVSVTFALAAARCFVRPPVDLMRNDMVPLDELWGRSGGCLRERLLEALTPEDALSVMEDVLLQQMTGVLGPDPAVIAAAYALSRGVPVGEVARDLGLLPRTLRRRFAGQVGLTPKRFARVQRMQRLVRDLDGQSEVDWAAAAARHGYADQPHLADEFRELAGVTPAEYLRSRVDGPNHLRFPPGGLEPSAQAAPTLERRPSTWPLNAGRTSRNATVSSSAATTCWASPPAAMAQNGQSSTGSRSSAEAAET